MLVVCKPLVTIYDGQELRLKPGVDHVTEDHALVRRYPQHFRPAEDRPPGSRERVAAVLPGSAAVTTATATTLDHEPRGRESWRLHARTPECAIIDRPSGVRARLAPDASSGLAGILDRTTSRDGLESAMLLFGASHSDLIDVAVAVEAPAIERAARRVVLDVERAARIIEAMADRGLDLVGDAHSHPAGSAVPSATDLDAFARSRAALNLAQYLALVCQPCRDGWRAEAWIVRGRRCERAELRGLGVIAAARS